MIRVIYRWKIKSGQEDSFVKAWARTTQAIRVKMKGARGSVLLRSRLDPGEFVAVARWEGFEDWQAFRLGNPPDPEASRAMSLAGNLLSIEIFDEIQDLLDTGP